MIDTWINEGYRHKVRQAAHAEGILLSILDSLKQGDTLYYSALRKCIDEHMMAYEGIHLEETR